ncbi:hypothetical protein [Aureimonas sp. Leaf324]|uniref:hypothetical protein n=1 Tax=Aureimonas sp. Leaf324 TaxID=1736336 RepID=UPI0006F4F1F8|nr:hypothetical protein [Aureimonas sp. Leaf324]KQQ90966.1 hypothetical protein ASF65_00025 [Aureimonas sp. Leaf324]
MAKKKKFTEAMVVRFEEGTFERFAAVLKPTEDRAEAIRNAALTELRRRERKLGIPPKTFTEFREHDLDHAREEAAKGGVVPDEWVEVIRAEEDDK